MSEYTIDELAISFMLDNYGKCPFEPGPERTAWLDKYDLAVDAMMYYGDVKSGVRTLADVDHSLLPSLPSRQGPKSQQQSGTFRQALSNQPRRTDIS